MAHEKARAGLIDRLIEIVDNEIQKLEFWPKGAKLQTKYPMPERVNIVGTNKTMKTEDLIKNIRNIANSSLFEE